MTQTRQIERLTWENASPVTGSGFRQVQTAFTRLKGPKYGLVSMIGYGEAVKFNNNDWKLEWILHEDMPARATITEALDASQTDVTMSAADAQLTGIGQMLYIDSEWMRVVSVAQANDGILTVTRGAAGSTAATHADNAEVRIGPQVFGDGDEFEESPKVYGEFEYNYPMLVQYELTEQMLTAATHNYLLNGRDPLDVAMEDLKEQAVKHLEHWAVYGTRSAPTDNDGMGFFGGIKSYLTTNGSTRQDLDGELTVVSVVDQLRDMSNKLGDLNGLTVMGSQETTRIFDALVSQLVSAQQVSSTTITGGIKGTTLATRWGDVTVVPNYSLQDGELYFLQMGDIKLHPADVGPFGVGWIEFDRGTEILNKRARQKGYAWAGTLKMGHPKRHGLITFTTTDGEAYANYM